MENNAQSLGGIPVRELHELSSVLLPEEKNDYKILIGTPENVMPSIEESLVKEGFSNIQRMDSIKWAKLQEEAFGDSKEFEVLSNLPEVRSTPEISVYMAKFWKDKALSANCQIPSYMIPIQAGAALTDVRVADVVDCEGDHISSRNGNYSELTVLYWIWKNVVKNDLNRKDKYFGLAHYRRFLMVGETELRKIQAGNVDVVLPFPMPYEPSIEAHHERYLSEEIWNHVRTAIHEVDPEYEKVYEIILNQSYMYNYNISIAKGNVFVEYCEWLFKILFRVEQLYDPNGIRQPNRYMGYVAETLTTLYFMSRKDKIKIAHVGCKFIV